MYGSKRMSLKIVISIVLITMIASPDLALQKRKSAPKQKASPRGDYSKYDAYPYVLPIEARIGYHRLSDPAVFLTLKNLGSNLTIDKVVVTIMVADPIRVQILKSYILVFNFAVPIKPKAIGESVATSKEGFREKSEDILPSACKNYSPSKEDPALFVPSSYLRDRDILLVDIEYIHYTDDSNWTPPKKK